MRTPTFSCAVLITGIACLFASSIRARPAAEALEKRLQPGDPDAPPPKLNLLQECLKKATAYGPAQKGQTPLLSKLQHDYLSDITNFDPKDPNHSQTLFYSDALQSLNLTLIAFTTEVQGHRRYFTHAEAKQITADFHPKVYNDYAAALTAPNIKTMIRQKKLAASLQTITGVLFEAWDHAFLAMRDALVPGSPESVAWTNDINVLKTGLQLIINTYVP